jgi:hypothetical protein
MQSSKNRYTWKFTLTHLTGIILIISSSAWTADQPAVECRRADPEAPPRIDGILNDVAWQHAVWYDSFTQSVPDFGEPATESTSVAFLHDDSSIYVAVRCNDQEPQLIRANKLRHRDNPRRDDHVQIIFDTYRDQTRGVVFVVNSLGAKEEGLVMGYHHYNWSWKDVWQAKTMVTAEGWQAELRIPLRLLRYSSAEEQEWGANVSRTIRRKHEDVYLMPPEPPFDISSLNYAVTLTGLRLDGRQRNLQVIPHLLAGATQTDVSATGETETDSISELGIDLKYSLTSDLTLDATYNTDFAQVESDDEQVNLTRFSLFFPEKREFFLENAQLFSFGPGNGGPTPELNPFFSRRIGLHEDGDTVPIDLGVRLTGKVGRQDIGILSVRTAGVDELDLDSALYNVARVRRDLGGRSYIGGLVTDSRRGDLRSTTFGIDGIWYITEPLSLRAHYLTVDDNDEEQGNGNDAYHVSLDLTTDPWGFLFSFDEVGESFDPDLGYVRRQGYRRKNAILRRSFRPGRWGVRRVSIRTFNTWTDSLEHSTLESSRINLNFEVEMENGDKLRLGSNRNFERLFETFELSDELSYSPGDYTFLNTELGYETDSSKRFGGNVSMTTGEFYDGDQQLLRGGLWYVFSRHFKASGSYSSYQVDSDHGDLDWSIWKLRLSYFYSSNMSVSTFYQYNSSTGARLLNLRFHWILRNDSDLFIVFNDRNMDELISDDDSGRDLAVKINYRLFL